MPIQVKTAGPVATVAVRDDGQGHKQGVIAEQTPQLPLGATTLSVGTSLFVLASVIASLPSVNTALIRLDPGAGIRWSTGATANGSLGVLLCAVGSVPEALQVVGSAMIAKFNMVRNGPEANNAVLQCEFYRTLL
jgi:hypothetical protein